MENITILCSVAAEFPNPDGGKPFQIGRNDLNVIKSAPEWVADTLMFKLLAADGSLKAVTSANRVQAENNPTVGVGADGKAIVADAADKPKRGGRKASVKKTDAEVASATETKGDAE